MDCNREKAPAQFDDVFYKNEAVERQFFLPFNDCRGFAHVAVTDDFVLLESRISALKPSICWNHLNAGSFVELNFILEGNLYQTQPGLLKKQLYSKGYHNCIFNPDSWESNELLGTKEFRNVAINIPGAKMIELLRNYVPGLSVLAEKIEQGKPFVWELPHPHFNNRLTYLLDHIWNSPETTGLKRLYFESIILEIICQQCDLFLAASETKDTLRITSSDRDKLQQARKLIINQLNEPPTIARLAQLCNMNEFRLKTGFRHLFGKSIFAYVHDQKLELAKSLIYGGGKTIAEIAYELGYAHPQHFHRAFVKRYGITPKQLIS